MSSDADADADGVVSTHSTQNVCNISHLKRRHVIMASLLLYNQQIMVQLLMIRGFCLIVLPKKKRDTHVKESITTTESISVE
jgi:hypothetical protein